VEAIPSHADQRAVRVNLPESIARVEKPDLTEPIDDDGGSWMCHRWRRCEKRNGHGDT
jgi:hypothetical protein